MNGIEIATRINSKTANLTDAQLYISRNGRELRDIAREAVDSPIIGTAKQIGERFSKYFPTVDFSRVCDTDEDAIFVWALEANKNFRLATRRLNIVLLAVKQL